MELTEPDYEAIIKNAFIKGSPWNQKFEMTSISCRKIIKGREVVMHLGGAKNRSDNDRPAFCRDGGVSSNCSF